MKNIKEDKELNILNHSCAHLLAHAVKRLYPDALFWVGPVIEEGFYYDIDLGDVVVNDDIIEAISKEMKKIVKENKLIKRLELSKEEALEMFANDPYKIDIIENLNEDEVISAYKQEDFVDLCRGPHVESTKLLKHFKLLKHSGAYYKGDSKNKVLQRIYGVCFQNEEDLNEHLALLEDAKERDHRKLGKDLGLFMMDELVGKGFPMWLPNGFIVRRELVDYMINQEVARGYQHVMTPSLGNVNLYKTSGHWAHYKDDMFPAMEVDDEAYVLRPMNCPHHMVMFKNSFHSYRDLPIRIAEIANDFRFESSGSLCGLERTRAFTQNDSHIFCRENQIKDEFKKVVELILDVYKDFGFENYSFRLSLRDVNNKEKYFGNDDLWEKSETALREVLNELGADFYEAPGEAAFYGPKLDVQVRSAIGHDVTLSTVQIDYQLPERFELEYVDEDGNKVRPVVIHRAIMGTFDRFMAFLIEETKGQFPLWLAPVQVNVIPVNNEYHLEYAKKVVSDLKRVGLRVELDDRNEKLGYKMRESQTRKINYNLVLGNKERDELSVTYRKHGKEESVTLPLNDFIDMVKDEIDNKKLNK
ncbi:MAG: threonine--tRNA ligase [Tenericutes bacterium]|nr:threonine--tRNA ligase [Mycoplasmatota bacterium]MDY3800828.1 threonine--tRNA ligase [Bacilli bacterium]